VAVIASKTTGDHYGSPLPRIKIIILIITTYYFLIPTEEGVWEGLALFPRIKIIILIITTYYF